MVRTSSTPQETEPVIFTRRGVLRGMTSLAPVSLFVLPFGVAFGIAAVEQGLAPGQALAMSAFVFTATAQFASLDFFDGPIPYLSLVLVVLALSARHLVMGAALATRINRLPPWQRLCTLALISDANFADARNAHAHGDVDLGRLFGGGLMLWTSWVISTAVGAFGGSELGDPDAYGAGVVMVCFFAASLVGMVRGAPPLALPALVAVGVAVTTRSVAPGGWNIILAALAGGLVAALRDDD